MDTRKDEQERTITIKSTGVSLFFEMSHDELEGSPLELAKKFAAETKGKAQKAKEVKIQQVEGEGGEEEKDEKPEEKVEDKPKEEEKKELTEEEKKKLADETVQTGENSTPFLINLIDSPGMFCPVVAVARAPASAAHCTSSTQATSTSRLK